ncbi:MAG: AAA family ATPase, partial [Desulfuromonadales bacterium]|nr:AAA family ATPase [Desulfuromonadales bacterium]NIS40456.1 AAA family ATPase [Desulfuromonadales bacterium]
MARPRKTRTPVYVRLSEKRIRQIEDLIDGWSYETRLFVLRRLRQYDPSRTLLEKLRVWVRRQLQSSERVFQVLRDPEQLSDWRRRFEVAGSQDASEAWNRILHRELDWHDYQYLCYLLERSTNDIFVPGTLSHTFDKLYRAHLLKEYSDDPEVPRAPLVLVIGSSGSGKTATIKQAIEEAIFASEVRPVVDLKAKEEEVLAQEPIWRSLEDVDPELAVRIERQKKVEFLRFCAHVPLVKYFFRERISRALSSLTEEGVWVDYSMVTPNDYQTAWAGEPGNYLRKAMGDPRRTCLRHLEEAHSAFGRPDQMSTVKGQQSSLIDAGNIILDEIIYGRRDCLLIATTDQPEQLDPTIYRRFVERGLVIDIGDLWEDSAHLREVVRMEMLRRGNRVNGRTEQVGEIDESGLDMTVACLYPIFRERSLKITPAYVRRLIDSIIA